MNLFTTDHPLMSDPAEHPGRPRIFTRKTLIWALMVSAFAEASCLAGSYFLANTSFLFALCGILHLPGLLVASLFVPDVADDYASKGQALAFECMMIAISWLQWFVLALICRFFRGPRQVAA